MTKININFTACVRSKSLLAGCTKCEQACDFEAISISNQSIKFYPSKCSGCLECIPVCPTNALSSPGADILGFVSSFLDTQDDTLSISETGFPPAAFDEQTILTLLVLKKSYIKIEPMHGEIHEKIEAKLNNINIYAKAFGITSRAVLSSERSTPRKPTPSDRRSFFSSFSTKNLIAAAKDINEQSKEQEECIIYDASKIDYDELRTTKVPTNRDALLSVIKLLDIAPENEAPSLFSTEKIIDSSCTNCELCYNLCPTGALSSTRLKNAINFEAHKCVKCALCEDVCATKSIHSLPNINLAKFSAQTKVELIKFDVSRCCSCGLIYTPQNNESVCQRCAKEDEDAMDLSGLF